jgi:hypothetical protein
MSLAGQAIRHATSARHSGSSLQVEHNPAHSVRMHASHPAFPVSISHGVELNPHADGHFWAAQPLSPMNAAASARPPGLFVAQPARQVLSSRSHARAHLTRAAQA